MVTINKKPQDHAVASIYHTDGSVMGTESFQAARWEMKETTTFDDVLRRKVLAAAIEILAALCFTLRSDKRPVRRFAVFQTAFVPNQRVRQSNFSSTDHACIDIKDTHSNDEM